MKTDGLNATLSDKTKMSTAALIQELDARLEFEDFDAIYPIDFIKDSVDKFKLFYVSDYIELKEIVKELYHRHIIKPTLETKGGTQ